MNRQSTVLVVAIFLFSPKYVVAEDLLLSVQKQGSDLVVEVKNCSSNRVKINTNISMDPLFSPIRFMVVTHDGLRAHPRGTVNPEVENAEAYKWLAPKASWKRKFDLKFFEKFFGVQSQCYSVFAEYNDAESSKFGAFNGSLKSRKIDICRN